MKVRIAFYKYNKKIVNTGISAWTWLFTPFSPAYSHVELGIYNSAGWQYFSSTNRDGAKGTRWAKEKDVMKHKDRWDVYEIEVDSIEDILYRASEILGFPYDWAGIFGFITIFGILNHRYKWYCSEACYFVLTGIWKKRISPRRFFYILNKKYNLIKIL